MPSSFTIAVSDARLAAIRERVEQFDWSALPDAGSWRSGVGLADLRRLVDYWLRTFDWRKQERRLNELPQFTANILGQQVHSSTRAGLIAAAADAGARLARILYRIRAPHRVACGGRV